MCCRQATQSPDQPAKQACAVACLLSSLSTSDSVRKCWSICSYVVPICDMATTSKMASRSLRLGALIVTLGIVVHSIFRIAAFIHIFFDHAGVLLTQEEILNAHSAGDTRSLVVPRITHQIFHNWTHPEDETLPEDWKSTRQTCLDMNDGWEHHVGRHRSLDFLFEPS